MFGITIILVLVELVLMTRLVLLTYKYVYPDMSQYSHTQANNTTNATRMERKDHYITKYDRGRVALLTFFVSALYCIEYLILGWGFLYKTYKQKTSTIPWSAIFKMFIKSAILLTPLAMLKVVNTVYNIKMEIHSMSDKPNSETKIYITYCILELFKGLFDYIVRAMMLTATLMIREVWFPKNDDQEDSSKEMADFDLGKNEAIKEHSLQMHQYRKRGPQVEQIMFPFNIWFMLPWITHYLTTSINPHLILAPWMSHMHVTRIFYLTYNVLKFAELLVQYLCALKMNQYHNEYYDKMRDKQILKYQSPKYQAIASKLGIDYKDKYNFYPTILKINTKINMENPLYILLLLLGIFMNATQVLA